MIVVLQRCEGVWLYVDLDRILTEFNQPAGISSLEL
jgi:hypothetical protein